MIELLKRWSEEEPERCKQNEMQNIFHLSYNLQNGHYIDTNHLTNEILAIIQRCVQNAVIARKWPFDLSFGSYGYRAWIQAEFGNPAYVESSDIVECLLAAYVKALEHAEAFEANRPKKLELIKTIYVPKNDLLECRCVYGCEVKFDVIPFAITPKAFGECAHFHYVMLLDDDQSSLESETR